MTIRIVIILIAACFFIVDTYSQVVTVFDSENLKPLEFATLHSNSGQLNAITNIKGQTDIGSFKGQENIHIRLLGYKSVILGYDDILADSLKVALEVSGVSLDEIIVSATRWDQTSKEVPQRISSIPVGQIKLYEPQTTADLLAASGEIFIQKSQQGGGSPMIRGFATNRLLITVDGVRMNTAIFRSGNLQNVISIDPLSLERAEVLFGPGSVIYGSDAIGGVMSFQTLIPQFSFDTNPLVSGKALTRFSSANSENTGHIDLNLGWNRWAMVSSFTYAGYDDLRMGSYGPDEYLSRFYVQRIDTIDKVIDNPDPQVQSPTAYEQINMMQKVHFRPNKHWDFIYGYQYSNTTPYARYDRLIRTKGRLPRSAEWMYGPQKWMMNNLQVRNSQKNLLYHELAFRAAYQIFEESRIDRDFNDVNRNHRIERVDAYSLNLDLKKGMGTNQTLFYGVEGIWNRVASEGSTENLAESTSEKASSRYPDGDWESYGAYLNWLYNSHRFFILQAGVRYNVNTIDVLFDTTFLPLPYTHSHTKQQALTGGLGIKFTPNDSWAISMNANTGFRAPNIDDMGKLFDSEPGTVIIPNPELKPEYAYNVELSVARVFGEQVKVDVTGFYTYLDNAMVRRNYQLNSNDSIWYDGELSQVQALQNAAMAWVYGVQASVEVKLPYKWNFISRINYQKGEEELDDGSRSALRHASPLFASAHLSYRYKNTRFTWFLNYNDKVSYDNLAEEERGKGYMYATDADGHPYAPSWYTLNFKLYHQINSNFDISGGVENITDQRYRPYSSGIAAAGRNFILALHLSF